MAAGAVALVYFPSSQHELQPLQRVTPQCSRFVPGQGGESVMFLCVMPCCVFCCAFRWITIIRFNAAAEKLAQDAARLESELEAAQV